MCAYICVCLQGVLQSQRYNGPTPSLREVLQNNPKQSTAAGREPWLACSWITSQGNSRYAISANLNPLRALSRASDPSVTRWMTSLCQQHRKNKTQNHAAASSLLSFQQPRTALLLFTRFTKKLNSSITRMAIFQQFTQLTQCSE